jgi:hypothetical protein
MAELFAPTFADARRYADQRHRETGSAYLVSAMGHVLWAARENRDFAENELGGIAYISKGGTYA